MTTIVPDPALSAGAVSFSRESGPSLRPWRAAKVVLPQLLADVPQRR